MNILYALEGLRSPFLDKLVAIITELGGEMIFMALAIAVFWCVSKSLGYYILSVGLLGTIMNQFLKLVFRVPRPWLLDPEFTIVESAREAAAGYSFPSGHTQNIFASFGSVGRWTKRTWLRVVCVVVIVLVAFSRMYLGVHTPKDVGVSMVLGTILVFVLYPVFRDIEKKPERMYVVLGALIALTTAYLLFVELWAFPADIDATNLASGQKNGYNLLGASIAMLIAVWFDNKHLHFPTKAPLLAQVVKIVLGLAITVVLKSVLKAPLNALFAGSNVANAVRYFMMVLFAAAIWPMTFRWFASWGKKAEKIK